MSEGLSIINFERFFILGPTAVGKSKFALDFAAQNEGLIINADSLQFFKDLKIGTAYPKPEDFNKVPHHLFGVCDLGESFTAGEFVRRYHKLENEILSQPQASLRMEQAKPILIVGGSGFYVKALETGMFDVTQSSMQEDLPSEHLTWSLEKKIQTLKNVDPKYLKKIGTKDIYRLDRALQIYLAENKSVSQMQDELTNKKQDEELESGPDFAYKLGLFLPKDELLKKVQKRTEEMIQQGLVDEVQDLLTRAPKTWKPLQSLGYKETIDYLDSTSGKTLHDLQVSIVKNTMHLIKKQMTWFRADKDLVWFRADTECEKAKLWLKDRLRDYLEQ